MDRPRPRPRSCVLDRPPRQGGCGLSSERPNRRGGHPTTNVLLTGGRLEGRLGVVASYLLVANETAESPELLHAATEIHARDIAAEFVIVVPATPLNLLQQFEGTAKSPRGLAAQRAQSTRRHLESLGIRVRSTRIGNWDPYVAIEEELVNNKYTAMVFPTLPPGV